MVDTPTADPQASHDQERAHDLLVRSFRLMESWDDAEAAAIIAPDYTNATAAPEPPAARIPGIVGIRATYDWLHTAYADLQWTVHTAVAEGEWVVARTTRQAPSPPTPPTGALLRKFPLPAAPSP